MTIKTLEAMTKWLFIICLITYVYCYFTKDKLPEPKFYDQQQLKEPVQQKLDKAPFDIYAKSEHYRLTPLFDYQLDGVVVTLNNAAQFGNIWHHRRWKDFINLRDLCVIWGSNVTSGIYKSVTFSSDSWTCWVSAASAEDWQKFNMIQLSNNHLLADKPYLQHQLMKAEIGDHIRLQGLLVNYKNLGNNFSRKTSTRRDDRGNGACETVYITDFQIIKKANVGLRRLSKFSFWLGIISLITWLCFVAVTPVARHR